MEREAIREISHRNHSIERLRQRLNGVIRGKTEQIEELLIAFIAGGSVLIQDVPGVGKTTLAKTLARSLDMRYRRVQCTPDLLPADILGGPVYDAQSSTFRLRRGPIFTNLLLVDEINRASPRTQSALLEAMAERQVSLDGRRYRLPRPFLVIATQNPTGSHGTFPLPESQLDRFMLQMSLEYPDREHEVDLLYDTTDGTISAGHQELAPVLSISEVKAIQAEVDAVHVDRRVAEYLVEIVRATRCDTRVRTGSSTRGTRMLFRAAQSAALLANRQFVMPDDVQRVAPLVLAHRIVLRVTTHGSGQATREVIQRIISEVAVPI